MKRQPLKITAESSLRRPNSCALLTVDEAAKFLRLTRATVYKLVRLGELPAHRFGASIRLSKHKLLELVEVRA